MEHHAAPEYKSLIAIHNAGKPKGGIDEWLKVYPDKVRRLSLSEQQLEKAVLTHGEYIIRYFFLFISDSQWICLTAERRKKKQVAVLSSIFESVKQMKMVGYPQIEH